MLDGYRKVITLCFYSTKVLTQTLDFIQVSNSHLERDSFLNYTYIYFKQLKPNGSSLKELNSQITT